MTTGDIHDLNLGDSIYIGYHEGGRLCKSGLASDINGRKIHFGLAKSTIVAMTQKSYKVNVDNSNLYYGLRKSAINKSWCK